MAEASQSVAPTPSAPEQRNENTSAESNADDGSSGSPEDGDLQHAQILAHARSVSTPPATPAITDEIELDITSKDVSEHAPGLYVARSWIRPPGLTGQEIDDILQRLNVDLTLACGRIRAKSCRKRPHEDMLMIDMRMAGTPARGSTKVTLRPCIWVFCGSKWCQKIVKRDVKALNWLGPYEVHFVRKGGPLLSADETCYVRASDDPFIDCQSSEENLKDDRNQPIRMGSSTHEPNAVNMIGPPYISGDYHVLTAQNWSTTAYGSAGVYGNSYPAISATSSTGAYEYQSELSGTSTYGGYTGYDTASVTDSSVPSYGGGGSVAGWSESRDTAASSAPSSQSYHQQTPPSQRYQLPCEFYNLTACNRVFHGDDTQAWIDHVEAHLGGKFPSRLRCWFCNDRYFDVNQTSDGDARSNFIMRMEHVRDHLVYDGSRPEQMQKDGRLVQHLLDQGLIDRRTYDAIVNGTFAPPTPPTSSLPTQHRASSGAWNAGDDQTLLGARASGQNWAQIQQNYFPSETPNACRKRHERLMERKGADGSQVRHHNRLPQVQEDVAGESSSRRNHHRSEHRLWDDRDRDGHRTGFSELPKRYDRTGDSDDAQFLASPSSGKPSKPPTTQSNQTFSKGKGRARDADYVQSLASISLSDHDPLATRSDYYDYSHRTAYGASPTGNDNYITTARCSNNSVCAENNGPVVTSRTVPLGENESASRRIDSVSKYFDFKDQRNLYGRLNPNSSKQHSSKIAFGGLTELRLHVESHLLASFIGLSCVSTLWGGQDELSRSTSKMGGAISITLGRKTSLYGVTSGHGMIHQLLDVAPESSDGEDSSIHGLSESSDSESEDGEDSSSFRAESNCSGDRASVDSAVDLSDHTAWTPIKHDITAGFLGIGVRLASQRESQPDESHAEDRLFGDLALFPIDSFHRSGLTNYYIEPSNLQAKVVIFISENEVTSILPVVVLLGPEQTVSGTLQPGKFHFSMRGTSIDARQIRLSRDLAIGSSGSWVVHDQTLYGMIIAVVPGECTAIMVPAKKMMSDIRIMCPGASDISVAVR